jgi:hypothetical protein
MVLVHVDAAGPELEMREDPGRRRLFTSRALAIKDAIPTAFSSSSSSVALQPISGLGLLFMSFLNLTLIIRVMSLFNIYKFYL